MTNATSKRKKEYATSKRVFVNIHTSKILLTALHSATLDERTLKYSNQIS